MAEAIATGIGRSTKQAYSLPESAMTHLGDAFDPRSDRWSIKGAVSMANFRFDDLSGLSPELIYAVKGLIMNLVAVNPARSASSSLYTLKSFLRHAASRTPGMASITAAHLMNYRASLKGEAVQYSTRVHLVIRKWAELGIPGIADDAGRFATDAPKFQAKRGRAVTTKCPVKGPYTDVEYDGLHRELHAAFAAGRISLSDHAMCLLSGSIAPRPAQFASLQVGDLQITPEQWGGMEYVLSIPRVKGRNSTHRAELTPRTLVPEIGSIIAYQAATVRERALQSGMADPETAPLFPAIATYGAFTGSCIGPVPATSSALMQRITWTLERLQVSSERTGKPLNSNSTRARSTLCTRAVAEGVAPPELAFLMDHSDQSSIKHYYAIRPEVLARISSSTAVELAPLAQRFMGLVVQKTEGNNHDVRSHVIGVVAEGDAPDDLGGCSKPEGCGLPKPIACYTCRLFRAWADGPHEAMLEGLLARRERHIAANSPRIASVLDETILACAEVVRQCALKAETQGLAVHG